VKFQLLYFSTNLNKNKMNKLKFYLSAAALGLLMVSSFVGCKDDPKDEPAPVSTKPELGTNFKFEISNSGEGNDVTFTSWLNVSTNATSTDAVYKVNIPKQGDYKFVFSVMVDGTFVPSDTFKVTIKNTDVSFLNSGVWKALTGGPTGNKVWYLDLGTITTTTIDDAGVTTTTSVQKSSFFHNPLDFYGDAEIGGSATNVWGPWGGTDLYGWGGTPEVGEISFNGVTGKVKLVLTDGVNADGTAILNDKKEYEYGKNATAKVGTFESTFSMITSPRDPNFLTLTDGKSLWENMITGKYSYLGSLSAETATLTMNDGVRFPMDKGRVGEQEFTAADLSNIMIMHASDSALVVRVKRSFEGYDATGVHKASTCWLLYNYVVKGYEYTKAPLTHPVKALTASNLEGTWKLAAVPGNWISWSTKAVMNTWADGAAMNTTFEGWSITNTAEKLAASTKVSLTFSGNNVTIHDVTFDGTAEVVKDYTTTYAIKDGYITFASDITINGYTATLTLSGKNVYVMDVTGSDGIWLGQNNGTKEESVGIHLVKAKKK
jgi:hypothetical protein